MGSGTFSRFWRWPRLGIVFVLALGALGAVLGAALPPAVHAHGIEGAADHVERPCRRPSTPMESRVPRVAWERPPGRFFTRAPRIITMECSCRLCPTPG